MIRLAVAVIVTVGMLPLVSQAATLYLEPREETLQVGEAVIMQVRVDVDEEVDECINLVDAEISYPSTIQAVDTSVGQSILQVWVERPTINAEQSTVTFAGGIPNGYCGRIPGDPNLTNVVAEIVFRHKEPEAVQASSTAEMNFSSRTTVYLNDGNGTAAPLTAYGATLELLPTVTDELDDPWTAAVEADTVPPQPFSISLERNDQMFDGDYYIVFNTTDKQTGIAEYEVMEEPLEEQSLFRFGAVDAPWQEAASPHRLEDQTLNSTIRVRVTDKAGNEYIATLVPDPSLRSNVWTVWHQALLGGAGLLLLLLTAFIGWRVARRPRRRKTDDADLPGYKADAYDSYDSSS